MTRLSDRVAAVTGGSSGIGRGIAFALADHGADVVVAGAAVFLASVVTGASLVLDGGWNSWW